MVVFPSKVKEVHHIAQEQRPVRYRLTPKKHIATTGESLQREKPRKN